MRKVLLINGHGGMAFTSAETQKLHNALSSKEDTEVFSVGNGDEYISLEEIKTQLENLNFDASQDSLTIIAYMHGKVSDGNFTFINGDKSFTSKALFELIASKIDAPVDFVSMACHGGKTLDDKDLLPKNSSLVSLAPGNITLAGADVDRFVNAIENTGNDLSSNSLLKIYMIYALKNRIAPQFGISNKSGHIDFAALLQNKIGKKINRDSVMSSLDAEIVFSTLESIIDKIETSNHEYTIWADEYGKALAICSADEFGKTIDEHNYKPVENTPSKNIKPYFSPTSTIPKPKTNPFDEI